MSNQVLRILDQNLCGDKQCTLGALKKQTQALSRKDNNNRESRLWASKLKKVFQTFPATWTWMFRVLFWFCNECFLTVGPMFESFFVRFCTEHVQGKHLISINGH